MENKIESRLVLREGEWPEKALSWPQDRTLADYFHFLMSPLSFETLSQEPKLPDIIALLSLAWQANIPLQTSANELLEQINPNKKTIVVDIGLGNGNALAQFKKERDVVTVGFGLHEIQSENQPFIDVLCYSPVPNGELAQHLFKALRGQVSLLMEVYGALTYSKNPVHAAIFLGLLLAPNGNVRAIMSSIFQGGPEQSPLGFAEQRQRLTQFFQEELGLKLIISRTYIKSRVVPGTFCVDYLVEIKRDLTAKVSEKSLDELFNLADKYIGACNPIPKNSSTGQFGKFSIQGRTYTRIGEDIQLNEIDIGKGVLSTHCQITGKDTAAFSLKFKSHKELNEFVIRFSEYYLNNNPKPLWSITIDKEKMQIALTRYQSEGLEKAKEEIRRLVPGVFTENRNSFFAQLKTEHANSSSNSVTVCTL